MISLQMNGIQLKSIIVGLAWGANKSKLPFDRIRNRYKLLPSIVTAQADADLKNFIEVLKHEGVKVYRPKDIVLSHGVCIIIVLVIDC